MILNYENMFKKVGFILNKSLVFVQGFKINLHKDFYISINYHLFLALLMGKPLNF